MPDARDARRLRARPARRSPSISSIHALDRVVAELTAALWRRLPGRGRRARVLARRAHRRAARSATSLRRCRGRADRAHRADPGRPGARRAGTSATARSTTPTIGAASGGGAGGDEPGANGARPTSAPVAVEHRDLERDRSLSPQRLGGGRARRRRRPRRRASTPAAAAWAKASAAVLAAAIRVGERRRRRPPRRALGQRSRDRPRPAASAGRAGPGASLVILATPPATVTRGDRMARADISACRRRNRPCRSAPPRGSPCSACTAASDVAPVAPGDVVEAHGARHVDAAMDGVDPGRAGIGHDDAGRAEDRQPADDARAGRSACCCGERLAAGNRRSRPRRRRRAPSGARTSAIAARIICARHRVDRRLAGRDRQAGPGHGADAWTGAEGDAGARRRSRTVATISAPCVTSGSSPASLTTPARGAWLVGRALLVRQREADGSPARQA